MADLSAYIDFEITLDKSGGTPKIVLEDTGTYPAPVPLYLQGIFSITQPDGINISGSFTSPDIYYSGGGLIDCEKELRLASDDNFQQGVYVFTYVVSCTGYTDTTLTKTFTLAYTQPTLVISPLIDVFTPYLAFIDGTTYTQTGYSYVVNSRAWQGILKYAGTSTITLTGTAALFDLIYSSNYYDANYDISYAIVLTYSPTAYSYLTLKDKFTYDTGLDPYTPPTLAVLSGYLADMKASIEAGTYCGGSSSCGCESTDLTPFTEANSIFQLIISQGRAGNTDGLQTQVTELLKMINCSGVDPQTHTNAVIPAYDFGSGLVTPAHDTIYFTVGSGAQYAPANGATSYVNPTISGLKFNVYRQAVGDYLVYPTEWGYRTGGGFTVTGVDNGSAFIGGERFVLTFIA